MAEQSAHRSTIISATLMPPLNSITIGEIENKLVYITSTDPEKNTIDNFIAKKGIIFKSIGIPIRYFERYSSNNKIENQQNESSNCIRLTMDAFYLCYSYFFTSWNLASPNKDKIVHNSLIFNYYPSITQQAINHFDDRPRNNNFSSQIIKFDYHPLYKQIIVAFKNGIVLFDMKRNCWLSNVLQNEMQTNITDFAICPLGMNIAVSCAKGIFLWNLKQKIGELMIGSYKKVRYSPDSKYIAVYKQNGKYVYIYDLYSNKMVYTHQMFYNIIDIQWIASTKSNRYCPLRLLFVTKSSYLFLLNMLSFEMKNFQCKTNSKVTHACVSANGNGIIAITAHRYLYYISLNQFCEPSFLADLYLNFGNGQNESNVSNDLDEKDDNKQYIFENKQYLVHSIQWSQCDTRIAVIYKQENGNNIAKFVSLWAYDFSTLYKLGFITNPNHKTFPLYCAFRNHFNMGALLAICWSNAIISQHHLCFNKSNKLSF